MDSTTIEVPVAFNSFHVYPRDEDEDKDPSMPRTIANAYLVFMKTGNTESADRCKSCMERYLQILSSGPTGSLIINIGQACICWSCGFVGLPANTEQLTTNEGESPVRMKMPPFAICKNCSSGDKTNFILGKQPDDSPIPFLEQSNPIP